MKMTHPQIARLIRFEEGVLNTIVIENRTFFRQFISDLQMQTERIFGNTVLSIKNEPVEISKHLELITIFVPFELNRKGLLAKVCDAVEKEAVNETNFETTQQILAKIENYINELALNCGFSMSCSKVTIGNLIKTAGMIFEDDYPDITEKIEDYMELTRELERDKLFVFVNMRSYFDDKHMSEFVKTALSHKLKLLLVDAYSYPKLPYEKRITIDEDLCEI